MTDDRSCRPWIGIVRDALNNLGVEQLEGGTRTWWINLPTSGGYYDQDEFFIQAWEIVRNKYIAAVNDEQFVKSLRCKHGKGKP